MHALPHRLPTTHAVSLLCPLWVVNATPLAVDAAITPLEAPQQQQQQQQRVQPAGSSVAKVARAAIGASSASEGLG